MVHDIDFISGERLQDIASHFVYIKYAFREVTMNAINPYDPRYVQLQKDCPFHNHGILYINSYELHAFICDYVELIQNPFVVVAHNSDQNLDYDIKLLEGLENPKCLGVYTQNPSFYHPKIHLLPIGIANSKWSHGNPRVLESIILHQDLRAKTNDIYFFFSEDTNKDVRIECKISLFHKIPWTRHIPDFLQYMTSLTTYKYAICPEGNGHDTHRLWECIYTQVIPIMKKSAFSDYVYKFLFPCPVILVDDWYDLNIPEILDSYQYPDYPVYSIQTLKSEIDDLMAKK